MYLTDAMASAQNYVSTELTHFVGGKIKAATLNEIKEGQYAMLSKILHDGRLISKGGSGAIGIDPFKKFTSNRMITPDGVCFCDIPKDSLGIHMAKYSPFGLAFSKSFLLKIGANPVFYVAGNAKCSLWNWDTKQFIVEDRATLFDKRFAEFYDTMSEAKRFLYLQKEHAPEAQGLAAKLEGAQGFMSHLSSVTLKLLTPAGAKTTPTTITWNENGACDRA